MLNVHEIATLAGQDVSSKRPIPKDTSSRACRGIYVITLQQAQGENNLILNVHEIAALAGQDVSSKRPIPKDTSSRARRGIYVITLRQAQGEHNLISKDCSFSGTRCVFLKDNT